MIIMEIRHIIDRLLSKRVSREKVKWIGAVIADPDWHGPEINSMLLNFGDAARKLGCSRSYFWTLRRKGLIPTVELNGVNYVRSADLEKIVLELPAIKEIERADQKALPSPDDDDDYDSN